MINTVLGEIYHSFSKNELRVLDQYITTSNWQYSDTIVKCHECFQFHTLNNSLESLNKEEIFKYVYEEEKHNDSKLRFLFNRLIEAIREFILIYHNKLDNVFTEKVWVDFIIEKKLRKNIQYNLEKKDLHTASEYRFLNRFFKSQEQNTFSANFSTDIKARFDTFTDLMRNAELFNDLVFIKNYCSLISFTNVYQSIPFELPESKLFEIKSKNWDKIYPEFLVYLSFYYAYKKVLFDNFEIWVDEEKVNFVVYLLNYTTQQINKGVVEFIDEQYSLFNLFEELNIFELKSYINSGRINNVVFIYLRKKEYEKATQFITKYVELLPDDMQDSCRHFNIARIYFENMKYKESLRELLQVDFGQDSFYSLNSKIILLKNYYELKESDAFDSLCSSFKEFIRKNKVVSENYKLSYLNFIKTIRKLYGATPTKLKKLGLEIAENKQLAEKNWLMEKCG
jgi:hypothetical protein